MVENAISLGPVIAGPSVSPSLPSTPTLGISSFGPELTTTSFFNSTPSLDINIPGTNPFSGEIFAAPKPETLQPTFGSLDLQGGGYQPGINPFETTRPLEFLEIRFSEDRMIPSWGLVEQYAPTIIKAAELEAEILDITPQIGVVEAMEVFEQNWPLREKVSPEIDTSILVDKTVQILPQDDQIVEAVCGEIDVETPEVKIEEAVQEAEEFLKIVQPELSSEVLQQEMVADPTQRFIQAEVEQASKTFEALVQSIGKPEAEVLIKKALNIKKLSPKVQEQIELILEEKGFGEDLTDEEVLQIEMEKKEEIIAEEDEKTLAKRIALVKGIIKRLFEEKQQKGERALVSGSEIASLMPDEAENGLGSKLLEQIGRDPKEDGTHPNTKLDIVKAGVFKSEEKAVAAVIPIIIRNKPLELATELKSKPATEEEVKMVVRKNPVEIMKDHLHKMKAQTVKMTSVKANTI